MIETLIAWLFEPFAFPFMQRALIVGLIIGSACALLSCYLVLKGWSLMGDAISHAVLPGIVLASLFGLPLTLGAFVAGLACTSAIGMLNQHSRIKQDSAIGIVFSGMFAIGLVLFSKIETDQHLLHILFGDVLGIHDSDFWQSIAISVVVLILLCLKQRDFLLYSFDPAQARIGGLNTTALHYTLLSLLALMIISAMQVVGVILVVAMLITPGITAFLLSRRFIQMQLIALFTATSGVFLGILFSFHWNVATGAMIILVQATLFIFALLFNSIKERRYAQN